MILWIVVYCVGIVGVGVVGVAVVIVVEVDLLLPLILRLLLMCARIHTVLCFLKPWNAII